MMWSTINTLFWVEDNPVCSPFCASFGYCDDWSVMSLYRNVKMVLSWCVCIQLLKVVKFTDTLIPKMNLATSVLYAAAPELAFFSFVFIISMFAFSQLFYIELGTVMERFNT